MQYYYLFFLVFALAGLVFADYRYRIVFFYKAKQAALVIGVAIIFFLIWDITGIYLDVFSTNQVWVSGFHIFSKDLPVEEILFLSMLSYNTLLVWRVVCSRMS